MQVSAPLGSTTSGVIYTAEESVENVAETAKVKTLETPRVGTGGTAVSVTVIGGTLVGVRKYFVGFVYFLEFFLGPVITVSVGVVLESKLAKGFL
jgi:hypothetical protein